MDVMAPRKPSTSHPVLRALALRVVVYGAMLFGVVCYVVGPPSLPWPTHAPSAAQEERPSRPGWPHVRGLHYDAHADDTELADSWPVEGPPVLWMRELGAGYSGLIAVGKCLYTQAQSATEQSVLALDAETGQTLWQHRYGWPYEAGGMYPGPRSTPTYANGRIYFTTPEGEAGCLRADNGQRIWYLPLKTRFDGRGDDFGYACSPLVEEGKVILPVGGPTASVVALDAATGETVWTSGDQAASYCGALPITCGGRRQIVAFLKNELAGFDLATGERLWRQPLSRGYDEHSAWPLYQEPLLRTTLPFQAGSDLYCLEVAGDAAPDGTARPRLVRHDARMSNDVASSVLLDGCVYGFDLREAQTSPHRPSRGEFRAMEFETGKILWSSKQPGHAALAVADGKLVLLNDRGEVVLLRANPERYEELARAQMFADELCWTAPAVADGRLFVRSPTRAACLYIGKPERLDRQRREQAVPTSALPQGHRWQLGWLLGAEREYPFQLPELRELLTWFGFSGIVLVVAGLATAIVKLLLRLSHAKAESRAPLYVLLGTLFLGGLLATPLGNRFSREFVFTWPLTLLVAHQVALALMFCPQKPDGRKSWSGLLASGLLVLGCLIYFDVTRRLALGPAWYFLAVLPLAWPVAIPAARCLAKSKSPWSNLLWMVVTFSVYFWIAGGILLWRGR